MLLKSILAPLPAIAISAIVMAIPPFETSCAALIIPFSMPFTVASIPFFIASASLLGTIPPFIFITL